jgi:nucleoside-diphosphate-sugar epimerase
MRVLVTGHHGYIGSVLVPTLLEAGHEVTGLDTFYYRGCDFGPDHEVPALMLDVRDVAPKHLKGFDAVVHLAALSNDPLGDLDPELTYAINFRATLNIARAAKEAGVRRFIFSSSCSMYGAAGSDESLDEEAPLRPLTPYAESKVRAEEGLAALADRDFSPVSMRNATAFGASPRLRLDVVLNNLCAWAFTTGAIRLMSDGSAWRPLVHVRDIASCALVLLEAPRDSIHGRAFNIGANAENYRVRELAEIVREAQPDCAIEFAASADADPRSYRVDFTKWGRTFPYAPARWTARRGTRELVTAFERVGFSRAQFEGHRYVRLSQLSPLMSLGLLDADLRWRAPAEAAAARRPDGAPSPLRPGGAPGRFRPVGAPRSGA